jgi:hypothetical protein
MATKVSRDGVVTRDDTVLGHVKKEMRPGMFAALLGSDSEGTPAWVPFAGDGTRLSDGCDTRKRAVSLIEKHAQPLTVSDLRTEYGLGSDRKCVTAGVSFRGYYFGVSRYANEPHWVIDYLSTPESIMPTFANGTGTRATRAHILKEEMSQAATDAAIAAGVWPITDDAN